MPRSAFSKCREQMNNNNKDTVSNMHDHVLLVFGGMDLAAVYNEIYILDPEGDTSLIGLNADSQGVNDIDIGVVTPSLVTTSIPSTNRVDQAETIQEADDGYKTEIIEEFDELNEHQEAVGCIDDDVNGKMMKFSIEEIFD